MVDKSISQFSKQRVKPNVLYRTIARTQANYLRNYFLTGSFTTPPLVAGTLDTDDVQIARNNLEMGSDRWDNPQIVRRYEAEFAKWNGSKYAFAFMGGRVALSACIYALGLKPGDEVIVPGYTCVVVPNSLHFAGATVVYSDIELDTFGLDASKIIDHITTRTRAIIIQHLYGLVCRDYEIILDIARKYHLKVIEDCAHATGATYQGRRVGTYGDCAFYSSEQSKVFCTIQGGLAVTDQPDIAEKIQEFYSRMQYPDRDIITALLKNVIINYYQFKHPRRWYLGSVYNLIYHGQQVVSTTSEEEAGVRPEYYGRRMPAPIAALGISQLAKIDRYNALRRNTAIYWDEWCQKNGYAQAVVIPGSTPIYLRYPVLVEPKKKAEKKWAIKELGVEVGVWFVSQTHPTNRVVTGCPNGEEAVNKCINFPCLPGNG